MMLLQALLTSDVVDQNIKIMLLEDCLIFCQKSCKLVEAL